MAIAKPTRPDLGATEILQDRNVTTGVRGHLTDGLDHRAVDVMRAVLKIQPEHVRTGGDKGGNEFRTIRCRANGCDDLCVAHALTRVLIIGHFGKSIRNSLEVGANRRWARPSALKAIQIHREWNDVAGLLEVLIRATRAVQVLQLGAGTGTSTLEIGAALPREGRLIALERDAAAAMQARAVLASAGIDRRVTVIIGNATRYLHKIAGPFDVIVQNSDAMSASIHDQLVSLLRPTGTLVTRNTAAAGDYNEVLAADTRLTTAFLSIDEGLAISVKRLDLT